MKAIKVIFGGYTQVVEIQDNDEESAQVQFVVFLVEKGATGFIDRMIRLVVIRDGKLVLV